MTVVDKPVFVLHDVVQKLFFYIDVCRVSTFDTNVVVDPNVDVERSCEVRNAWRCLKPLGRPSGLEQEVRG